MCSVMNADSRIFQLQEAGDKHASPRSDDIMDDQAPEARRHLGQSQAVNVQLIQGRGRLPRLRSILWRRGQFQNFGDQGNHDPKVEGFTDNLGKKLGRSVGEFPVATCHQHNRQHFKAGNRAN